SLCFFFHSPAPTHIHPLSLHDALPISALRLDPANPGNRGGHNYYLLGRLLAGVTAGQAQGELASLVQSYGEKKVPKIHGFHPKKERKSTRLNSSHDQNSYAVFCLKKKK